MKYASNRLALAIRLVLTIGAIAFAEATQARQPLETDAAGLPQGTPPPSSSPAQAKNLKAVVVTGSMIKRVDIETANPVVTLGRAAITAAGTPTLGNVLQQLPSVTGYATNGSNNNNGGDATGPALEGGDGAARISLRGLGPNRTLVLVDGMRLINADLNMVPQSMIERADVLAEGASTVYGSDAIGGVVNFILRKHFSGVELNLNDGISSHGDGQRRALDLTAGKDGDNYNIVAGVGFNKYDATNATRRFWSRHALYLSNGVAEPRGSNFIPTGNIQLPASFASRYGCSIAANGTIQVTRAQGNGSSLGDYRCYNGASDAYNYQAFNYIVVPQKRTNAFVMGSYNLTDNITAFANAFYNRTESTSSNAANTVAVSAPSATSPGFSIAADNPINPFGVTFSKGIIPGQPNSGYDFRVRLTAAGLRLQEFTTKTGQFNAGLRGNFGQSSWTWDAAVNYGHTERTLVNTAQVVRSQLNEAVANGANIFDQSDPTAAATLSKAIADNVYVDVASLKAVKFDAGGNLWDLPAGSMQLSVGALFRKRSMSRSVPPGAVLDLTTLSCGVGSCDSDASGSDNVKEIYAETLIPILSERPWAHSLNLDFGIRTSDYSTVGATTNKKIAIEWRPVADLLVRGTISQVFRAPDLHNLYDGPFTGGPTLNDPCYHLSAAELAQHAAACQFVPPFYAGNGNIQTTNLTIGAVRAGTTVKPEQGKSVDLGLVYGPNWLPGLSTSVDLWHVYLYDTLVPFDVTTVVNGCFNNNSSPYCSFIVRNGNDTKQPGLIFSILTPYTNLGNLSTSGVDYTLDYRIPHFDVGGVDPGDFKAAIAATYTSTYKNSATPGQPGATVINYAGSYTAQFGNIPRWRGTVTLNWNRGNWSGQWQGRYINKVTTPHADTVTQASLSVASIIYQAIQLSYEVPKIHTRFSVGIDNVLDKQPPLVYQNSILTNNNVDTATYDTLGRYYWARATIKF